MTQPVRVYRIGPLGPKPVIEPGAFHEDLLPTLAVIPFTTRGIDDEHSILGEVLAEELIQDLSRSPELHVISRLSTTVFRGREATLDQVSTSLNANYVLSGSYRIKNSQVVLEIELAEAKSGQIAWAGRYKGQLSSVISGKRDLIDEIAANVSAAVMVSELRVLNRRLSPP